MTSISRINSTITDHGIVASSVAACLVILGVLTWNTFIYQNGNVAKTYDNPLQPFTTTQTPANETTTSNVQTVPQVSSTVLTVGKSSPLSLQNQPQAVTSELQSAQTTNLDATASVNYSQPSVNTTQLTGNLALQNATASIQ